MTKSVNAVCIAPPPPHRQSVAVDPRQLPIYEIEDRIVEAAKAQSRLILRAPTGSGKSTQVPQMLLDRVLPEVGQIVVLQPRRMAARMLASRVAQERGEPLGETVGYQVRMEGKSSARTRILYVTEGILLRRMIGDPELHGVSAVVFDEFHERHLYGDITLARALDLQESSRPDLKIVVMSATLEVGELEKYLAPCQVLESAGRTFPVDIRHIERSPGERPPWELAAEALTEHAPTSGHALVFMPGAYEIQRTISEIRATSALRDFGVFALHGEMPAKEQDEAVSSGGGRKIIVSTNVAETSLTIEGVTLVIDSGLARIARYDARRGINTLLIEKISWASADQRAGRAGRTAPGRCVRLWMAKDHEQRPAVELPEIKRLDLAEVVLSLKAAGVADLEKYRWLESPEPRALMRAEELLRDLGALDPGGRITELGRRMLAFPVHPRYARLLLEAEKLGCVKAACLLAALTQGRGLLVKSTSRDMDKRRDEMFRDGAESDVLVQLRAFSVARKSNFDPARGRALGIHMQSARQAAQLADKFSDIAHAEGLNLTDEPPPEHAMEKCMLAAFPDHLAKRLDRGTLRCDLVHGRRATLARDSVVAGELLVAGEITEIGGREGDVQTLLTLASPVHEEWLQEMFGAEFTDEIVTLFDPSTRGVVARRVTKFRDLVLRSGAGGEPDSAAAARIFAEKVASGDLSLPLWNESVEQWIARLNCLAEWMPSFELPRIGDAERRFLFEQLAQGVTSYRALKDKDPWPVLRGWLSAAQLAALDAYAPERIKLPGGRSARVVYSEGQVPVMAARVQDLYGVDKPLTVADGAVRVRVEVLAPNQRPIQVTDDMGSFWQNTYPQIRPEYARRYPKHEWR
ncbi:MAG: ATP-dependent helicase HrpB [Chthoniobacterales bacterium]|nr:ATP-dependent helicase HrpB [Chthoniobacterales bacterium]